MNVNIKIIRYKSKEQTNGTAPLALRITKQGERSYVFLKHFLREDEWNEEASTVRKNNPNSKRLNIMLSQRYREAEKISLDAEENKIDLTAKQLKKMIQNGGFSFASLTNLAVEYLKGKQESKKYSQYISDKGKFKSFLAFLDQQGLSVPGSNAEKHKGDFVSDFNVKNITGNLLRNYKNYLEGLGQRKSSVYNKLNVIRIIYNRAIGKRLVDKNTYPFGKGMGQIQLKPGEGMQEGLDQDELDLLEFVDLSESNATVLQELQKKVGYFRNLPQRISNLVDSRNVFMFSYYFAGVRIADVLKTKWSDFRKGRYYYFIGKNSRPVDVLMPEEVMLILEQYRKDKKSDDDYVFPFLKKANLADSKDIYRKTRNANKLINDSLALVAQIAGLDKKPSIHISRHTFGAHAKGNISPEVLQDLYRHQHLSTTLNYQKKQINKEKLDKGLADVINSRRRQD